MTLARRRLLHRRVAAALGTRDRGEQQAAVIAHHLALGGDEAAAAELYRVAGDRARALYANAEALGHYRAALALGFPDPAVLHAARSATSQTLAGDYGGALASYQAAAALAGAGAAARGRAPHRRPAPAPRRVGARRGLARDARSTAWRARRPRARPPTAASPRTAAGTRTTPRGSPPRRSRLAEQADDPRARAQAHNILGILATSRGDGADAVRNLEQALALAQETRDPAAEAAALNNLALAVAAAGETERALELTRAGLARAVEVGDRHREAALRNRLADLLHAAGRDDEAMPELKAAVAIFAEVGEQGKLEPEIWKLSEW